MTKIEKTVTVVGGIVGVLIIVFGMGAAWNTIDARFEKMDANISARFNRVDAKVSALERARSTAPCLAILTRQIEAIERNKAAARAALEGLSREYRCGRAEMIVLSDLAILGVSIKAIPPEQTPPRPASTTLWKTLRRIDAQLNAQ